MAIFSNPIAADVANPPVINGQPYELRTPFTGAPAAPSPLGTALLTLMNGVL